MAATKYKKGAWAGLRECTVENLRDVVDRRCRIGRVKFKKSLLGYDRLYLGYYLSSPTRREP